MRTIETIVYTFDELTEEAQEKAIENLHDINTGHEWWDFVYEDSKEIAKLFGLDIEKIYFSGFSSQGDGACVEGSYYYKKGGLKAVKDYAPKDEELHQIVKDIQKAQKPFLYSYSAKIKQRGFYMHSGCTQFGCDYEYGNWEHEDDIEEALREFMDWIYSRLEKEYEYLTSKEAIKETIIANEYEFTEDGELA